MKTLRNDIRDRDVMKKNDLEALALLLGDKWANVISGIKAFQSVFKEHGMSHNDLHSWNILVITEKDWSYKTWIIDFGQVTLSKKQ
jgi:serine/threonine-protein kinase RIO1